MSCGYVIWIFRVSENRAIGPSAADAKLKGVGKVFGKTSAVITAAPAERPRVIEIHQKIIIITFAETDGRFVRSFSPQIALSPSPRISSSRWPVRRQPAKTCPFIIFSVESTVTQLLCYRKQVQTSSDVRGNTSRPKIRRVQRKPRTSPVPPATMTTMTTTTAPAPVENAFVNTL